MITCLVVSVTLFMLALPLRPARHEAPALPPVLQKHSSPRQEIPEIRGYAFSDQGVEQHALPGGLREASGLAFTDDGRLLCHSDERGVVYEINYQTGKAVKQFGVGRPTVVHDFEGIAVKGDTVFLVTSSGWIFYCREGADGKSVSYQTLRTPLDARYNVEGLAYDPVTDCLLLACKGSAGKGYEKQKAVYAFSLRTRRLQAQPRFLLPLKALSNRTDRGEFNPSGLERHPVTGHFFVIAYNGASIVELAADGSISGMSRLPKSVHRQPEGIAIAADGTMVIANEGQGRAGMIVVYRPVN